MLVTIYNKVQYLVKHCVISEKEYDMIIKECFLNVRDRTYMSNFYSKLTDEIRKYSINGFDLERLYNFLMKKYEMIDKNLEEVIKDKWYRQRSGYYVKSAIKS